MKATEYILSAIVAFALVYVIFDSQKPLQPEQYISTGNGFTIEFSSIPTALEDSMITIPITITGTVDSLKRLWFRNAKSLQNENTRLYQYDKVPLTEIDKDSGLYQATLSTGNRANKLRYYFEVRDQIGRFLAGLKIGEEEPLTTTVVGSADDWIKYAYYFFMLLAVFAITKGAIGSIILAGGKGQISDVRIYFLTGLIFNAISAVLLRTWHDFQLLGDTWRAVPFGTDLTDNFQQILLAYLLFMTILTRKGKRVLSRSVIGLFGILSFFIMATVFLVLLVINQESIPISVVSYICIGLIFILALFLSRSGKPA